MNHMRNQQKNRNSRNKGGRNKSSGNVVNRVYESAGPEGKVRGTPQQIIDKYLVLARDAQTSGDRVIAENFLQHAEHYIRLLNAAMPPQTDHVRAPQFGIGQDQPDYVEGERDQDNAEPPAAAHTAQDGHGEGGSDARQEPAQRAPEERRADTRAAADTPAPAAHGSASGLETYDVGEESADAASEVVETPENATAATEEPQDKPKPRRRTRKPRNVDEVAAE